MGDENPIFFTNHDSCTLSGILNNSSGRNGIYAHFNIDE